MDRDTAARRVRLNAWKCCGTLPYHLVLPVPMFFFFDNIRRAPQGRASFPGTTESLVMFVGVLALSVVISIAGHYSARRGLVLAKHFPGLPGERACRIALRGHVYLPLAAFLAPFVWLIVMANR